MSKAAVCGAVLALGVAPAVAVAPGGFRAPLAACEDAGARPGFFKDEWISNKVAGKLQFNKALLREKIDVKASGGVVTLSGNVSTREQIALAGKLARQVSGVRAVSNYLQVGPPLRDTFGRPGGSS